MSDDFLDPRLAERLARAARAAQALSETLWEALHEELADPRGQRVAELSERLGEIAATVASLARADAHAGEAPAATVAPESPTARMSDDESDTREPSRGAPASPREPIPSREPTPPQAPAASPAPLAIREPPATGGPLSMAVLVDELVTAPTTAEPAHGSSAPPSSPVAPEVRAQATPRIEIRDARGGDARGGDGPAAWIGSIGRRLERHKQDGSPFAVLLVELVDIGRLGHSEPGRLGHGEPAGEMSRLTSQVEDALARALRPADSLTRESPGRYWLLAPQTDGTGARMLAEQLARAVRSSASNREAPVEVAMGIAVCPEDGRQASELAAHADVALYAARAAGRSSVDR